MELVRGRRGLAGDCLVVACLALLVARGRQRLRHRRCPRGILDCRRRDGAVAQSAGGRWPPGASSERARGGSSEAWLLSTSKTCSMRWRAQWAPGTSGAAMPAVEASTRAPIRPVPPVDLPRREPPPPRPGEEPVPPLAAGPRARARAGPPAHARDELSPGPAGAGAAATAGVGPVAPPRVAREQAVPPMWQGYAYHIVPDKYPQVNLMGCSTCHFPDSWREFRRG